MISISETCPLCMIMTDLNGDERVEGHCHPVMLVLMMDALSFLMCATEINMGD